MGSCTTLCVCAHKLPIDMRMASIPGAVWHPPAERTIGLVFGPPLKFFKVNSKGSTAKQIQYSSQPQSTSTSSSLMLVMLSVVMFSLSNNYDAQEEIFSGSDKLQGVSEGFSRLLVEERKSKKLSRKLSCSSPSSCHSSWFRSSRESGSGSRSHGISSSWISSDGIRISCSWWRTSSSSATSRVDESVEIVAESQIMLQCVRLVRLRVWGVREEHSVGVLQQLSRLSKPLPFGHCSALEHPHPLR